MPVLCIKRKQDTRLGGSHVGREDAAIHNAVPHLGGGQPPCSSAPRCKTVVHTHRTGFICNTTCKAVNICQKTRILLACCTLFRRSCADFLPESAKCCIIDIQTALCPVSGLQTYVSYA